jgi:hypothetical protein
VLTQCSSPLDAKRVLLRKHDTWPLTILHLCRKGANKKFIQHDLVQAIVSEAWEGKMSLLVPEHTLQESTMLSRNFTARKVRISPERKLRLRGLSYFFFLVLFSVMLRNSKHLYFHEGVSSIGGKGEQLWLLWTLALLFDEIDQYWRDCIRDVHHLPLQIVTINDIWNWMDCITLSLILLVVLPLRRMALASGTLELSLPSAVVRWSGIDTCAATLRRSADEHVPTLSEAYKGTLFGEIAELSHECPPYFVSWYLLSFTALMCCLRFVGYTSASGWLEGVGVLLDALRHMAGEMLHFLAIFGALFFGFLLFTMGMLPNDPTDASFLENRARSDAPEAVELIGWAVVGEYFEPHAMPPFIEVLLWVYAVLSQVILINLLIATMNESCAIHCFNQRPQTHDVGRASSLTWLWARCP